MFEILAGMTTFKTILSVIVAILILLATITVHEFGHYLVGKIFKFKINEFAIGMGPAIFKKVKKNGEIFSIRIFPLGGFCAFEGEDEDDETVKKANEKAEKKAAEAEKVYDDEYENASVELPEKSQKAQGAQKKTLSKDAFNNKKPWQRILVLLAGATFNFLIAVLIVMIYFTAYGHFGFQAYELAKATNSIETEFSLQQKDVITEIDGKFLYFTTDLADALNGKKAGDLVKVTVRHENGEKETLTVSLRSDVNISGMTDVSPALKALGIASVLHISAEETSPFHGYDYVFRVIDDENRADCTRLYTLDDFYGVLKTLSPGETVSFIVPDGDDADEENDVVTLTAPLNYLAVDKDDRAAVLGCFGVKDEETLSYQVSTASVKFGFFEGIGRAVVYSFKTIGITLQSFGQLLTGKLSLDAISGPVGTISLTTQYVSLGFKYVLNIASMIGLSVAIFNLLPIPALDGARAVFVLIEWIRKKPINRNVEGMIHFIGLIALLGFAILVDVLKLF